MRGFHSRIQPPADAPCRNSRPTPATLSHSTWGSAGRSISRCGVPRDAPSVDAGFPATLHQLMRGSPGRSISRCGVRRDAPSVDAGFPGTLYQLMWVVGFLPAGSGKGRPGGGHQVREDPPEAAIRCESVWGKAPSCARGSGVCVKCGRPQPCGWGLDQCVSGGDLLSHTLPGAVPSALWVLASGFGMGPGVSPTL